MGVILQIGEKLKGDLTLNIAWNLKKAYKSFLHSFDRVGGRSQKVGPRQQGV